MTETEIKIKLKKCPFCGYDAELTTAMNESWVTCLLCRASSGMADSEMSAIEKWNLRWNNG